MKRLILVILAYYPSLALADPLDTGEAYSTRPGSPQWMDNIDLSLWLVDYGIFALTLIGMGWLLFRKPTYLARLEAVVRAPFRRYFRRREASWRRHRVYAATIRRHCRIYQPWRLDIILPMAKTYRARSVFHDRPGICGIAAGTYD